MTAECRAALDVIAEIQANSPALALLFGIAVAALLWQWYEDHRRDRICAGCGNCQTKIHGTPDVPPPSSGVPG